MNCLLVKKVSTNKNNEKKTKFREKKYPPFVFVQHCRFNQFRESTINPQTKHNRTSKQSNQMNKQLTSDQQQCLYLLQQLIPYLFQTINVNKSSESE